MTTAPSGGGERVGIIEAVRTPLGFFALIVLVIEAIFAVVAGIANGVDRTITIGGMLFVILALISIVAYFAYRRPEALAGKREEINFDIEPVLAPLRNEAEKLKRENAILNEEIARLTAMRFRVWTYMDTGTAVQIDDVLRRLDIVNDRSGKGEVEAIIGSFLQENLIKPDTSSLGGSYRVIRTPAGERP